MGCFGFGRPPAESNDAAPTVTLAVFQSATNKISELTARDSELKEQLARSKQVESDLADQLASSKQAEERLTKELAESKDMEKDLSDQLASSKQIGDDLREQLSSSKQLAEELTEEVSNSKQVEDELSTAVSAHEARELELEEKLSDQGAKLEAALELSAQQGRQLQALTAKNQGMAGQIQVLQEELDGKRRQVKAYSTQVMELKTDVARKLKQQDQLKSKYLKMQEAMKMLEEVVVHVVGGQQDATSNRLAPAGKQSQLPKADRPAGGPGTDIVAKRFNQLRASANELRQSFAALNTDGQQGPSHNALTKKLGSAKPEAVAELADDVQSGASDHALGSDQAAVGI